MSRLAAVKKGRLKEPLRYMFYGGEGTGKTTLAAHAPDPLFLDIEDGSGQLPVARYSFRDGDGGHVPANYADVLAAIDDLTNNPHGFKTLVIDTLDRLEALIHAHMVTRDGIKNGKGSIEDYGYGKGYNMAVDEWRAFGLRLDRLRTGRKMNVVLLAHSAVRTFKNPTAEDFDRYQLRLNEKAGGFLKEWADVTGFVCFEDGADSSDKNKRVKGFSTGRRLIKFQREAAFDAKTRIPMPARIELELKNPWAPLARAVEEGESANAETITQAIEAELARLADDDLAPKVRQSVKDAGGDVETLSRYLVSLKNREPKQQQQNAA